MNTELFIESNRLDITADISTLLTFSIDDIKDFSSRSTTWSKTVVLPGTANNNKIFGHIFQIGRSNPYNPSSKNVGYNFNASKGADCVLFQDQFQTFKGVLRLLQINYLNGFNGRVEYEVSLFGQMSSLNTVLSGKYLTDIDFSTYNHAYTLSNILQSWNNPGGSGYYYPLIDYGNYSTDKKSWDIHTFRAALYAKDYIDKIFSSSGFRYASPLINSARFAKLIIPHSKKLMSSQQSQVFTAAATTPTGYGFPPTVDLSDPNKVGAFLTFQTISGSGFTANGTNTIFTYNGIATANLNININVQGNFQANNIYGGLQVTIYKNTPNLFQGTWTGLAQAAAGTVFTVTNNAPITISMSPGDTIQVRLMQDFYGAIDNLVITSATINIQAASGTVGIPIQLGDTVTMNDMIPQNIRQIDFLVGIVKLFNLYVYEDKNDPYLIYITPFIDFYSKDFSNAVDWTNKLDRSKVIKVKPMSEINAKVYKFRFKADTDYYNDLYRKRYNEGYGDRIYDSEFEFSQQTNEFEIVFSASPLVGYGGEDKVYTTIFKRTGTDNDPKEEPADCNIRILQTKKVNNVNFWQITNGIPDLTNILATLDYYGYAGHLDDPKSPSNDLNFGATKEVFFIPVSSGGLINNQFNVYWSNYMAEITHRDSKLVSAFFKLDTVDIINLDFSKYIYIDGITFRINQIKDYNATRPGTCEVELFKINSASYTEAAPSGGIPNGCFLLWSNEQVLDADDTDSLVYEDCGTGGGGPTPPVTYNINWSVNSGKTFGNFRIYINNVLSINVDASLLHNVSQSGQFPVTAGDVIRVRIQGTTGNNKTIFVSNSVDGVMTNNTGTSNIVDYIFTEDANKNYNIQGTY